MKSLIILILSGLMLLSATGCQTNDSPKDYQVVSLSGELPRHVGCKILRADAIYAAIYTKVFGPASREECERWVRRNCKEPATPSQP